MLKRAGFGVLKPLRVITKRGEAGASTHCRSCVALDGFLPASVAPPAHRRPSGPTGEFTRQDPSMISLRDAWGAELIDIQVIPPEAEPAPAAAAMVLATRSVPTRAPRGSSSSPPRAGGRS